MHPATGSFGNDVPRASGRAPPVYTLDHRHLDVGRRLAIDVIRTRPKWDCLGRARPVPVDPRCGVDQGTRRGAGNWLGRSMGAAAHPDHQGSVVVAIGASVSVASSLPTGSPAGKTDPSWGASRRHASDRRRRVRSHRPPRSLRRCCWAQQSQQSRRRPRRSLNNPCPQPWRQRFEGRPSPAPARPSVLVPLCSSRGRPGAPTPNDRAGPKARTRIGGVSRPFRGAGARPSSATRSRAGFAAVRPPSCWGLHRRARAALHPQPATRATRKTTKRKIRRLM